MNKKIVYTLLIIPAFFVCGLNVTVKAGNQSGGKARRVEKRADKQFIKGTFDKAIKNYEKTNSILPEGSDEKLYFNRKLARLYTLLLQYDNAITHYTYVYNQNPKSLSVEDVCRYIDALRQNNQDKQAEIVCRSYAFDEDYSRNQLYVNILNSLTYNRHYYNMGENEYEIKLLPVNTSKAEYWVGKYEGRPFYGLSNSYMQDPQKIYYHQNLYYSFIDTTDRQVQFPFIPRDLQNGPISFSEGGDIIIVTVNRYNGMDKISLPYESEQIYRTNLYVSYFDKRKRRWSSFKPLFSDSDKASYAHPFFADHDQTIYFASNRPGGHGGMDIYQIRRISETEWSQPENLGPVINTEGNEIYPVVMDNQLSFSSNGHAGFGGYDVYNAALQHQEIQKGTVMHYPYPVNTAFNDFGLNWFGEKGYLVSDRNDKQDDIFLVTRTNSMLLSGQESNVRLTKEALRGRLNLINGYNQHIRSGKNDFKGDSELFKAVKEGDVLLTLFFDFDSDQLNNEEINILRSVLSSKSFDFIDEVKVVGYADELGTDQYNYLLSERRARAVSDFLVERSNLSRITYEGKGKLYFRAMGQNDRTLQLNKFSENSYIREIISLEDKIQQLRPARKVDIIVVKTKR